MYTFKTLLENTSLHASLVPTFTSLTLVVSFPLNKINFIHIIYSIKPFVNLNSVLSDLILIYGNELYFLSMQSSSSITVWCHPFNLVFLDFYLMHCPSHTKKQHWTKLRTFFFLLRTMTKKMFPLLLNFLKTVQFKKYL